MTRFWISFDRTFELVLFTLKNMEGGEIIVPKIPSMKLTDLFDVMVPGLTRKVIGIRPGEKLHEILLTQDEAAHAIELEKYFVIIPQTIPYKNYDKYRKLGKKTQPGYSYTSDTNSDWLKPKELAQLI